MKYFLFSIVLLMIASMISCSSKGDELKDLPPLPGEPVTEEPNPIPGPTDKIVIGYVTSWHTTWVCLPWQQRQKLQAKRRGRMCQSVLLH